MECVTDSIDGFWFSAAIRSDGDAYGSNVDALDRRSMLDSSFSSAIVEESDCDEAVDILISVVDVRTESACDCRSDVDIGGLRG